MHYVKRLQQENKDLQDHKEYTARQITSILVYLDSDKFKGPGNQYVNSKEMFTQLLLLRSNL
jgi:hypothetical protein